MKGKKSLIVAGVLTAGVVGVLGVSSVMAAETVGTVTGKDGDVKDKVAMTAEVVSVDGSHVRFKDVDTGKEYDAGFGPSWYTKAYSEGDKVDLVGVETEADNNDNGHNFQVMEADGKVLRESFEGKPAWAGTRGNGNGEGRMNGQGQGRGGQNHGSNFIDADGDGVCDNAI